MSTSPKTYFFCGIGGSGMMPLAVLLKRRGEHVIGSDRSYDQGKNPDKFASLKDMEIEIYPQDGRHVNDQVDVLVVSSAIENSIPDVASALKLDIPILKRGFLLAELFNAAKHSIAVAGTSGKSTVTGMIATILEALGEDPTLVNGGEVLNFKSSYNDQLSGVRNGRDDLFVAEMDESDGSIAHYNPSIAVLNNVALDHKSMEELEQIFGDYTGRAGKAVIANFDNARVAGLCSRYVKTDLISYGINNADASLRAVDIVQEASGVKFNVVYDGAGYSVSMAVPGIHNVENALAALGACLAYGIDLSKSTQALSCFRGIHRRMEMVGRTESGIVVIDDFAHNPDKISASLRTLKEFDGRLVVMFQPHGFGPLRLMGLGMVDAFSKYLGRDDLMIMPEVYYAGGTVDRSVTSRNIIDDLIDRGVNAHWFANRDQARDFIIGTARSGDRIVIMGARDDTLHVFARDLLEKF